MIYSFIQIVSTKCIIFNGSEKLYNCFVSPILSIDVGKSIMYLFVYYNYIFVLYIQVKQFKTVNDWETRVFI